MSKSLNRVQLLGHIGNTPEIKTIAENKVANFSIATMESYKDSSGNKQEITDWHKIVVWGKLAEIVEKYVSKGSKVFIEGKLKTRSYEKDSKTSYITEVKADSIIMLDGKEKPVTTSETIYNEPIEDETEIPF